MSEDDLVRKMENLQRKIERLNRERNTLLRSNKRLVTLLGEMESFIQHNVEIGRISERQLSGDTALDSSEELDFDRMRSQVERIESEIHRFREDRGSS
jgi:uncharacterized protein (UPF0335 family)